MELDRIRSGMFMHLDTLLRGDRHFEAKMMKARLGEHPLFDPGDTRWLEHSDRFPSEKDQKKNAREWKKIQTREKRYLDSIVSALKGIKLAQFNQMEELRSDEWWKNHGKQVRREMKSEKTLIRESAYRMYDLTWRNCADWGYIYLEEQQEPGQALLYLRAWCSFDQESSTAYLWLAIAYARLGQENKALKALETAIDNGFSDTYELENEASFDNLRSNKEYKAIIEKMKDI